MDDVEYELIHVQNLIHLALISNGVTPEKALNLSSVAIHVFMCSDIVKPDHKAAYADRLLLRPAKDK